MAYSSSSPYEYFAEGGKRLKINNLPGDVTRDDFRELCKKFGRVIEVEVIGRGPRKFGYVSYLDVEDASSAYIRLNKGMQYRNQEIYATLPASNAPKKQDRIVKQKEDVKKQRTKKVKGSLVSLTPRNPPTSQQSSNQTSSSQPTDENAFDTFQAATSNAGWGTQPDAAEEDFPQQQQNPSGQSPSQRGRGGRGARGARGARGGVASGVASGSGRGRGAEQIQVQQPEAQDNLSASNDTSDWDAAPSVQPQSSGQQAVTNQKSPNQEQKQGQKGKQQQQQPKNATQQQVDAKNSPQTSKTQNAQGKGAQQQLSAHDPGTHTQPSDPTSAKVDHKKGGQVAQGKPAQVKPQDNGVSAEVNNNVDETENNVDKKPQEAKQATKQAPKQQQVKKTTAQEAPKNYPAGAAYEVAVTNLQNGERAVTIYLTETEMQHYINPLIQVTTQ